MEQKNHVRDYFGGLDENNNGNADENGEFYRLADFNNNENIGCYQRKMIDKVITETGAFDNVFYEIGNELFGSSAAWIQAVVDYLRTKTDKVVTQNQGERAANIDGWSQHMANTPSQVKDNVAKIICLGHPAWEDPDGSDLARGTPDALRQAAWYSFTGGAAGWGGFTYEFWAGGSGLNESKVKYYQHLASFIQET